jgi:hypothetical protein
MNKLDEGTGPKPSPEGGGKNNPLTSWTVIVALLGAGALPCPDCGMPLAWHLWPLALLILGVRWIAHRKPARPAKPGAPVPPDQSGTPRET